MHFKNFIPLYILFFPIICVRCFLVKFLDLYSVFGTLLKKFDIYTNFVSSVIWIEKVEEKQNTGMLVTSKELCFYDMFSHVTVNAALNWL